MFSLAAVMCFVTARQAVRLSGIAAVLAASTAEAMKAEQLMAPVLVV